MPVAGVVAPGPERAIVLDPEAMVVPGGDAGRHRGGDAGSYEGIHHGCQRISAGKKVAS